MESALRTLLKLLEDNGAVLHSSTAIVAEDDGLRVESSLSRSSREVIACIPGECLLPASHFQLGIEGNDFVIESVGKNASPLQVTRQETMLEIYNLSNKVQTERTTSMALAYDERDALMTQLLAAGPVLRERTHSWHCDAHSGCC